MRCGAALRDFPPWLRADAVTDTVERRGKLVLRTGGAYDLDRQHLLEVFGEQRQRFVAILHGFGPGD